MMCIRGVSLVYVAYQYPELDDALVAEVMRRYGVTTKGRRLTLRYAGWSGFRWARLLTEPGGIGWEGHLDEIRRTGRAKSDDPDRHVGLDRVLP